MRVLKGSGPRSWIVRGFVIVVLAVTVMGCAGVEPTKSTRMDRKDLVSTRAEVQQLIADAVTSAADAVGGERPEFGKPSDTICGEAYPKKFRRLEVNGSFTVKGFDQADVIAKIRDAWRGYGWNVDLTGREATGADDKVVFSTTTKAGVKMVGSASVLPWADNDKNADVNLGLITPCLKLSKGALDMLRDEPVDESEQY